MMMKEEEEGFLFFFSRSAGNKKKKNIQKKNEKIINVLFHQLSPISFTQGPPSRGSPGAFCTLVYKIHARERGKREREK